MFIKTWKIYLQCTLGTDFKKCAITSIRNLKMSATWDFQHRQWWLNLIVAAGWRKYNSQNASKWAKWDSQKSRLLCCDWERRPVGCAVQKHYRGFNKRRAWVFTTLALAPTCRVSRSPRRQQTLHKQRQLKAQRALITQRSCVCVRPSLLVLLHLLTRCHARLPLTPTPAGLENAPEVCLTYHGLRREAARAVFTLSAPAFFSFCFFFFFVPLFECVGDKRRRVRGGSSWERAAMMESRENAGGGGEKDASWRERRLENLKRADSMQLHTCSSGIYSPQTKTANRKEVFRKQPAEGPSVLFT